MEIEGMMGAVVQGEGIGWNRSIRLIAVFVGRGAESSQKTF